MFLFLTLYHLFFKFILILRNDVPRDTSYYILYIVLRSIFSVQKKI